MTFTLIKKVGRAKKKIASFYRRGSWGPDCHSPWRIKDRALPLPHVGIPWMPSSFPIATWSPSPVYLTCEVSRAHPFFSVPHCLSAPHQTLRDGWTETPTLSRSFVRPGFVISVTLGTSHDFWASSIKWWFGYRWRWWWQTFLLPSPTIQHCHEDQMRVL